MARYFVDPVENIIRDRANDNRVLRDSQDGAPYVFGNRRDAEWYTGELNMLRTPEEILLGI